jgi:hypothetical protein
MTNNQTALSLHVRPDRPPGSGSPPARQRRGAPRALLAATTASGTLLLANNRNSGIRNVTEALFSLKFYSRVDGFFVCFFVVLFVFIATLRGRKGNAPAMT